MKRTISMVIFIFIGFLIFISGCASSDDTSITPETPQGESALPGEGFTIGVLNVASIYPYYQATVAGMEEMADRLGCKLIVLDSEGDVGIQMANLESLISQQVDAILLMNVGETDGGQCVEIANEAGIPIISVSRETVGAQPLSSVVTDYSAALLFAEDMARLMGGKGKVAEIQGVLGVSNVTHRHNALKEVLEANPEMELLTSQVGNFDPAITYSVAADILTAHPDVEALYIHDDASGEGALQAIKDMGKQDTVRVFATGGTPSAVDAIAAGDLYYTCALLTGWEGACGVKFAVDHLNGKEIPEFVTTPVLGITKDNVDKYPGETAWFRIDWEEFPFPEAVE